MDITTNKTCLMIVLMLASIAYFWISTVTKPGSPKKYLHEDDDTYEIEFLIDETPGPPKEYLLQDDDIDGIEFLINTTGCHIKNVKPFAKSILSLIKEEEPFVCDNREDVSFGLVYVEKNELRVEASVRDKVLEQYSEADKSDFYCCVDFLKRFEIEKDDLESRKIGACTEFNDTTTITGDIMYIACYVDKEIEYPIYENFDFSVLRKSGVEERCRAIEESELQTNTTCENRLSVLIMGIDSLSRLQSIRHLNRTRQVLRRMEAIEFLGYSRVAENTYPNLGTAMLAGKTSDELEETCVDDGDFLDNCTFLMDYFKAAGYRTAYVEDANRYTTFTCQKSGFRRLPADYYGRTLFNGMDKEGMEPNCFRVGNSVPDDEAVFQWAVEFQTEFARYRHFGLFWINEFSHDYMNKPQLTDQFLHKQLEQLFDNQLLNNTLLVLMSDHGIRADKLFETAIGRFEVNLPMMFLVFPSWFRKKHRTAMQKMEQNAAGRLTTHYDMHVTLRDIANCRGIFSNHKEDSSSASLDRGINLFELITVDRTCEDAGIPDQFCPCSRPEVKLSSTDDRAQQLGRMAVAKLNEITAIHRTQCAQLDLLSVDYVKVRESIEQKSSSEVFSVIVTTTPGNGKFETYISYSESQKSYVVGKDAIRLNRYGNNSACIRYTHKSQLFPICYCLEE